MQASAFDAIVTSHLRIPYRLTSVGDQIKSSHMEVPPAHPVLRLTAREVAAVRAACNMTELDRVRDCMEEVRRWYRLQPHMIKEDLDAAFVERILLLARGSTEIAKQKIDAIATVRTLLPEFYSDRDVQCEEFRRLRKFVRPVPLPTLNKDLTRVIMVQMRGSPESAHVFEPLSFYRFVMLINDNRMYIDYPIGDTYVIDMAHFRLLDFTNFNVSLTKKVQVITSAYGIKLKGIHFINAPSYIDKVVFILKQGLKQKIAERIHVHSSYEGLFKHVSKDCLPVDYGGPLPKMDELYEGWMSYLNSETSLRQSRDAWELRSDESRRVGGRRDEDMLGIPGSFRTLSVD